MKNIKLLPCPFCGATLENEPPSKIYAHPRNDCMLTLRGITKEDFEKWNTRKPIEQIVKSLDEKRRLARKREIDADSACKFDRKEIYSSIYEAYEDSIEIVQRGGAE